MRSNSAWQTWVSSLPAQAGRSRSARYGVCAALLAAGILTGLAGCPSAAPRELLGATAAPQIRVLLDTVPQGASRTVAVNGSFQVLDRARRVLWESPVGVSAAATRRDDDSIAWSGRDLGTWWVEIVATEQQFSIDGVPYRGTLRLYVREAERGARELVFVNAVALEQYLAGVLRGELPKRFADAAQAALAIAARTYALYQIAVLPSDVEYHVLADERSQVYRGLRGEDAPARKIVAATSGLVLVDAFASPRRIFETFYCCTCGGTTQPARLLTGRPAPGALEGGISCSYCGAAGSPFLTWPEVKIARGELTRRLVNSFPSLEPLGPIARIDVVERTAGDRPALLRLVGDSGRERMLRPEELRVALGGRMLKSAWCEIARRGNEFVFTGGRGYGHGVGLCQYGAQGLALAGRSTSQILSFYYPGSSLERAY
ncbi:MAG: hypothetical protein CHACPFDD_03609 [Phycisphaerae bacterium]|nr:hypothetical protein [Phycisphaerae bacterium]